MPSAECKQCMCQICTCGHHNCPPGRHNAGHHHEEQHFAGNSEYEERYKEHDSKNLKRPQKVVAQYKPNADRLEGSSTSKTDYKSWETPVPYKHQQAQYKANPDRFEGHTVTETDYKPWEVHARAVHMPEKANITKDGRDWSTNTHSSYVKHDAQPRYQHPKAQWHPTDAKFNGQSVATSDYTAKEVHRRVPRASEKAVITKDDRSFDTNTKVSYQPHEAQARYQHPKQMWHPNENRFAGQSTTVSDYTNKELPPRYVHAAEKAVINKDDRSFETNTNASFQPHSAQPRYQHPKAVWHPSDNKFQGESIATSDYTEKHTSRAQPIKPPTNMTLPSLKFAGSSVYHDAYEQKEMPSRFRHEQAKYQPNPDRFAGESSSKHDYTGQQLASKTGTFKPNLRYHPDNDTRDFHTENNDMYTPKKQEHCRIFDYKGVHSEKAKDGHVYYDHAVPTSV